MFVAALSRNGSARKPRANRVVEIEPTHPVAEAFPHAQISARSSADLDAQEVLAPAIADGV